MIQQLKLGQKYHESQPLENLSKQQVAEMIQNWRANKITAGQLASWARKSLAEWENDKFELEDEDLLTHILYELGFVDEDDHALSEDEAHQLLRQIEGTWVKRWWHWSLAHPLKYVQRFYQQQVDKEVEKQLGLFDNLQGLDLSTKQLVRPRVERDITQLAKTNILVDWLVYSFGLPLLMLPYLYFIFLNTPMQGIIILIAIEVFHKTVFDYSRGWTWLVMVIYGLLYGLSLVVGNNLTSNLVTTALLGTAITNILLLFVLIIVGASYVLRQQKNNKYPNAIIVAELLKLLAMTETEPKKWTEQLFKQELKFILENIATCVENNLSPILASNGIVKSNEIAAQIANSFREQKDNLLTVERDEFMSYLATSLKYVSSGNWVDLEQSPLKRIAHWQIPIRPQAWNWIYFTVGLPLLLLLIHLFVSLFQIRGNEYFEYLATGFLSLVVLVSVILYLIIKFLQFISQVAHFVWDILKNILTNYLPQQRIYFGQLAGFILVIPVVLLMFILYIYKPESFTIIANLMVLIISLMLIVQFNKNNSFRSFTNQ